MFLKISISIQNVVANDFLGEKENWKNLFETFIVNCVPKKAAILSKSTQTQS